jgi:hypothetical protein
MGERKSKVQRFIKAHPKCIFCGGAKDATTIEHCPPRALFQSRIAPEGFEFPSCAKCNNYSSDEDLIVAVIVRMGSPKFGDSDGKLKGMMMNLNRQRPEFYKTFLPSAIEARANNRQLGIEPESGQTHQEAGVLNVNDETRLAIRVFAKKLAKGILYKETNLILKNDDCLVLNWFTNANVIRDGGYKVFELLNHINGKSPKVSRANVVLNNQFEYKFSISDDQNLILIQAKFGESFGLVILGSRMPKYLENLLAKIFKDLGADYQPFEILQGEQG